MKSRSNWRHFRWRVSNWLTPRARRAMYIVGASGVLLVLSPLLLGTVLAIRLESPGPVLFGQERIGRHGKPFKLWKFRSMYIDAEERLRELQAANESEGGVLFKMKQDPRITRVGRIIRKLSIDELPQLWNVLRGEMALVGPRPALAREVALYEARAHASGCHPGADRAVAGVGPLGPVLRATDPSGSLLPASSGHQGRHQTAVAHDSCRSDQPWSLLMRETPSLIRAALHQCHDSCQGGVQCM